ASGLEGPIRMLYGARDPPTVKGVLRGPSARLETGRLRIAGGRGQTGPHSPVIKDMRDVLNAAGLLGCPEPEVVILRAFKARAYTSDLMVQSVPDCREMRRVAEGQEELWRPTRLKLGRVIATVAFDFIMVAVNNVDLRVLFELDGEMGESAGIEEIVVVQEHEEYTARAP